MGSWGAGSFENDDAADFAYEFERDGVSVLIDALGATDAGYLEAREGTRAVAACEFVAAALGRPGDLPPEIDLESSPHIERIVAGLGDLRAMAIAALERVMAGKSELKEFWQEAGAGDWLKAMESLRARLAE